MNKNSIPKVLLIFVFLAFGIKTMAQQTVELPEEQLQQKGYYIRLGVAPAFGTSDFDFMEYSAYGFFLISAPGIDFHKE